MSEATRVESSMASCFSKATASPGFGGGREVRVWPSVVGKRTVIPLAGKILVGKPADGDPKWEGLWNPFKTLKLSSCAL